jgi:hypothetical protein
MQLNLCCVPDVNSTICIHCKLNLTTRPVPGGGVIPYEENIEGPGRLRPNCNLRTEGTKFYYEIHSEVTMSLIHVHKTIFCYLAEAATAAIHQVK